MTRGPSIETKILLKKMISLHITDVLDELKQYRVYPKNRTGSELKSSMFMNPMETQVKNS